MLEYLDATEELLVLVMGVERSDIKIIIIIITYYNISHGSFISYLLHNHSDATYEYECSCAFLNDELFERYIYIQFEQTFSFR